MAKTFDSTRIQVKAVNVIPEKATEVYNHVRFLVYQSLRDSAKKTYDTYTKILEETVSVPYRGATFLNTIPATPCPVWDE